MKKIVLATLLTLTSTTLFAAPLVKNITPNKRDGGPSVSWGIYSADSIDYLNNESANTMTILFFESSTVSTEFNVKPDIVNISCDNKPLRPLQPGSSTVCTVSPGGQAVITIRKENFKHGAEGFYTLI